MKAFCKNHRKELAFVIFYLAYVYVACFVLYTSYHRGFGVYLVSSPYIMKIFAPPPRWTKYLECAKLYLPGLFMILAWISLINQKYGWYAVFASIVFGNLFLVWYTPVYFWLQGDTYNDIEYLIVISVFFLVLLFYFLGKKRQWVFWVSNIAVFFTAINRELKELQKLFHYLIESKPNVFAFVSYLPHYIVDTFLSDLFSFLEALIYNNILKINLTLDDMYKISNSVRETLERSKEYLIWACKHRATDAAALSPRYYWYIRVFLLASILILGILLGYQKRNSQKEKIRNIGK